MRLFKVFVNDGKLQANSGWRLVPAAFLAASSINAGDGTTLRATNFKRITRIAVFFPQFPVTTGTQSRLARFLSIALTSVRRSAEIVARVLSD
jgi:hypothetical protein